MGLVLPTSSLLLKKIINNFNITIYDINRAELIYGLTTPLLQGEMTRYQPKSDKIEHTPHPVPEWDKGLDQIIWYC